MIIEIQVKADNNEQYGISYDTKGKAYTTSSFLDLWDELGCSVERKLLREKLIEGGFD